MQTNAKSILAQPFQNTNMVLAGKGILVGILTGFVVSIFRLIIDHTLQGLYIIYPYMKSHPATIIGYVAATIVLAWILGRLIKPYMIELGGSGIPQVEAELDGEINPRWWPIFWRKFVGGLLAICPGMFLGREGPCIQMGSLIGQGCAEGFFVRHDMATAKKQREKRVLIASGVAAGLSAAFSAPVAGALFLLEEITLDFDAVIWLTALAAALASDLVTILFFGLKPSLQLTYNFSLPLKDYWMLLILGVILGLLAYAYQWTILNLHIWYGKLNKFLPACYHSVIPLLLIIPIGLWHPLILGGSHNFILELTGRQMQSLVTSGAGSMLGLFLVYFVVRYVFSMLCYGAGTPGGIFMPILVMGATLGAAFASAAISMNLISTAFYLNLIIYAMAAYFGAIEKAPFTAVILISEMVGSIKHMLPLLLVTLVAYLINDWLGGQPIYGALRKTIDFSKLPSYQPVEK